MTGARSPDGRARPHNVRIALSDAERAVLESLPGGGRLTARIRAVALAAAGEAPPAPVAEIDPEEMRELRVRLAAAERHRDRAREEALAWREVTGCDSPRAYAAGESAVNDHGAADLFSRLSCFSG